MNKDFFTKPISLKDIKMPKISIKGLKNNKLIFICIFIVVFFIVIAIIGSNLLNERDIAKKEKVTAESKYNTLMVSPSKEVMQNEIINMELEILEYEKKLTAVQPSEFSQILKEFRKMAPIKWDEINADYALVKSREKELESYDIYRVNIKQFTGKLKDIEAFLEYVDNYEKVVRIESLKFNKNQATGNLIGQISLSFYFKKLEE